ncbi:hypothetical protein EJ05DRAFT_486427 [Pseudovirgaria hyperparasitica]|uniref:Transmembrane protein n=1 Tax=Pseudovirgaria hyperparasitica TaxID=470096 RepID=A0A6A6W5Y8_9PEZI|nr:uncharacterized protein EJ05DRAFT_486427 [Pseudovirgaria hyperparasitica]KAF2757366.1 hypothetical protein EJ05DRAFT_486427 [Pseudovirgaria hyperparasitica]
MSLRVGCAYERIEKDDQHGRRTRDARDGGREESRPIRHHKSFFVVFVVVDFETKRGSLGCDSVVESSSSPLLLLHHHLIIVIIFFSSVDTFVVVVVVVVIIIITMIIVFISSSFCVFYLASHPS